MYSITAQALSGVFLAEQIRQQQLAAALESRLDSQSFSAMQAALLMNKLKAMGSTGQGAGSSMASAAAASAAMASDNGSSKKSRKSKPSMADKLSKNTVANLLAASRTHVADPDEPPELTIEPIFKGLKPEQR